MSSLDAFAQTPGIQASDKAMPAAPAGAIQNPTPREQPHFDIMEYVVDGNTVLKTPEIEEAVYPYLGEGRTEADVEKARDTLQSIYQKHGFQTVQVEIPQQGVDTGVVHLQVSEKPVGRLRVVDAKYHLPSEIKETAPSLAEGKVVNATDVQKDIVALNQNPGLKVTPQLLAGDKPDSVNVDLKVEDTPPWHANVELNNQHNASTKPLRTVGSVSYDNLWGEGHTLSLSYTVAPQDQSNSKVFSGSYLAPIPGTRLSILAYGVKSDSDVAAIASTDVVGRGGIVGLRGILTLPGSGDFFHTLTIGLDRKDLLQNVVTAGQPAKAPVLYYPISLAYHAGVIEGDPQAGGTETDVDASVNFALPGIGSDSTRVDYQRVNASLQYIYLRAGVSRIQPLPFGMALFGKLDGQISPDPLISSEQFSQGGVSNVRGYLESERIGDYGVHGTIELRSPSVANLISPMVNDWRFHTFFDGAGLWLRTPLAGEQSSYQLYGIGFGSRLTLLDDVNADVDVAFPLTKGSDTRAGDMRVHFRVSSGF